MGGEGCRDVFKEKPFIKGAAGTAKTALCVCVCVCVCLFGYEDFE